jgi:hypothetical protein
MPRTDYVEKTIFNIEGVNVDFFKDGKNVRSEVQLPYNYKASKATKNAYNVSQFKEKLKSQFPGYDFKVYDGNGNSCRGNMLLANVRDTYLDD